MPRRTNTQQRRKVYRRARLRRFRRDAVTGVSTSGHRSNRRQRREDGEAVICTNGKTGFTKRGAEKRLEDFRAAALAGRGRRHTLPERIYLCPLGDHYHLTSQRSARREA